MLKIMFFIEREFHFSIFRNLMLKMQEKQRFVIGLYSPVYQESNYNQENFGIRKETVSEYFDENCIWIQNPYTFLPDITIIADPSYEKVEDFGFIVNIGHGTISKGYFFTDTLLSYRENCADLLCLPGRIHEKIMQKYLFTPFVVTGMPKLDSVFLSKLTRDQALNHLELNLKKKTVLIAPTINKEFSLMPLLQENIRNVISDEFNIIIKVHGFTPKEQIYCIESIIKNNSDIVFYDDYHLELIFIASDIMISDVSSIAFEFMTLGKPVLLYDSPYMNMHPKFSLTNIEHKYRHTIIRFNQMNELDSLINTYISDYEYIERLKKIGNSFVSVTDGSSSEMIIANILHYYYEKRVEYLILSDHEVNYNKLDSFLINTKEENSFDSICEALNNTDFQIKYIFFLEEITKSSPNIIRFMKTGLDRYCDSIIVPLRFNDNSLSQYITTNIPETQGLTFEQIAPLLSYMYSGISVQIDYFKKNCFAVNKKYFLDYLNYTPQDKRSIYDFTKWIKHQNLSIYLIYDVVVD